MKNKAIISGAAGLTSIIAVVGLVFATQAYQGDYSKKGPAFSEDRHEAMTEAFENNDYAAWKELMPGEGRVSQVITEENFAQFAEAWSLAKEGDYEGAKEIKEGLGLGKMDGRGQMKAFHRGVKRGMGMNRNFKDVNGDGVCDHLDIE